MLLPEEEDDSKEQIKDESQPDIHVTDPNQSTLELTDKEAVVQILPEDEEEWTSVGTSVHNMKNGSSGRVDLTFDIEFERLGLTLPNGTRVLQVSTKKGQL